MLQQTKEKYSHFLAEVWRVRWMLAASVAVVATRSYGLLPEDSVTLKTLYRPAIGAMGFVVAHVAWSQAFHYIDMGALLDGAQNGTAADVRLSRSVAFAAVVVARLMLYSAFVVGAMLAV